MKEATRGMKMPVRTITSSNKEILALLSAVNTRTRVTTVFTLNKVLAFTSRISQLRSNINSHIK